MHPLASNRLSVILDGIDQVGTIQRWLGLLRARSRLICGRASRCSRSTLARRQVVIVLVPLLQEDFRGIPNGATARGHTRGLRHVAYLIRAALIGAQLDREEFIDPRILIRRTGRPRENLNRCRRAALNRVLVTRHLALVGRKLVGIADNVGCRIDGHADLSSIVKGTQQL